MAKPPRSAALKLARAPLSFPIGVRAPATMYEPGMAASVDRVPTSADGTSPAGRRRVATARHDRRSSTRARRGGDEADALRGREPLTLDHHGQEHRAGRVQRGDHGDDRDEAPLRRQQERHVRRSRREPRRRGPAAARSGERSAAALAGARTSAAITTDVSRPMASGHSPASSWTPEMRRKNTPEAEAGAERDEQRLGVGTAHRPAPADERDGHQRRRDAEDGQPAWALARDEATDHRHDGRDDRRDGRHDRHPSGRQSAVEQDDAEAAARPAGRAEHEVGRADQVGPDHGREQRDADESERVCGRGDAERRGAASGQPAREVPDPVAGRGDEGEEDGHRGEIMAGGVPASAPPAGARSRWERQATDR